MRSSAPATKPRDQSRSRLRGHPSSGERISTVHAEEVTCERCLAKIGLEIAEERLDARELPSKLLSKLEQLGERAREEAKERAITKAATRMPTDPYASPGQVVADAVAAVEREFEDVGDEEVLEGEIIEPEATKLPSLQAIRAERAGKTGMQALEDIGAKMDEVTADLVTARQRFPYGVHKDARPLVDKIAEKRDYLTDTLRLLRHGH